jgi:galactose mutarotase-like enzyme
VTNTITNGIISFSADTWNAAPLTLLFNNENYNYLYITKDRQIQHCFPLMGWLPDNHYTYGGKQYTMNIHGFAQEREFNVSDSSDVSLVYEMRDDAQTYSQYPWHFVFQVKYSLIEKNLKVDYIIKNIDEKAMYFSAGSHTRFACNFVDCYMDFEHEEGPSSLLKSYQDASLINAHWTNGNRRLLIDRRMLEKGSFCLHPASHNVKLHYANRFIKLNIGTANMLQFWTPSSPNLAEDFLAMEVWFGSTSHLPMLAEDGDWVKRPGTKHIESGETCTLSYTISTNQEGQYEV